MVIIILGSSADSSSSCNSNCSSSDKVINFDSDNDNHISRKLCR